MTRFFNTAGLCFPNDHYMIDPLKRFSGVMELLRKRLYFTIHAPRQTGKTTYLHVLAQKLNSENQYIALVASFERAGVESLTLEKANEILIDSIYRNARIQLPEPLRPDPPRDKQYLDLSDYLTSWCQNQEKPIVLFIDEIDALMDDLLVSVLRQLRDGYQARPKHFPSSIVLVGLRDVREYKAEIRKGNKSLGTASPFNVKSRSLYLNNFTKGEVFELLEQHTEETGQVFPIGVKDEIYRLANGQPWLTNALANQIISEILADDYTREITIETVTQAKNQLILRRDTHLDSLVDKLKEERVKRIVQAILNGDQLQFDILDDHIAYVRDLGLVSQTSPLTFANPIYAEIVPRIMASPMQESLPMEIQPRSFVSAEGHLDMEKVLKEFQEYYRRNSGAWLDRYEYKESAHHLLLMAFLQRVINAGGEIIREMALGNKRIDMLVKYKQQEFALELKIKRDNLTIEDGKKQLAGYLDQLGLDEGYLVIFDPTDLPWEKKIYLQQTTFNNKTIHMVGL
jgi:AAA domain